MTGFKQYIRNKCPRSGFLQSLDFTLGHPRAAHRVPASWPWCPALRAPQPPPHRPTIAPPLAPAGEKGGIQLSEHRTNSFCGDAQSTTATSIPNHKSTNLCLAFRGATGFLGGASTSMSRVLVLSLAFLATGTSFCSGSVEGQMGPDFEQTPNFHRRLAGTQAVSALFTLLSSRISSVSSPKSMGTPNDALGSFLRLVGAGRPEKRGACMKPKTHVKQVLHTMVSHHPASQALHP